MRTSPLVGDAVGEVAEADDEGQHPDDHDRAGDGVGAGDEPGDGGDDPAAHDAAPEDGGGRIVDGVEAELRKGLNKVGSQCGREGRDCGEGERSSTLAGRTVAQRRRVFQKCFFSARTRATG